MNWKSLFFTSTSRKDKERFFLFFKSEAKRGEWGIRMSKKLIAFFFVVEDDEGVTNVSAIYQVLAHS